MTDKQSAFASEYIKDQCGRDAAIRAGFSERSAAVIASRLLRHPEVSVAIAEKRQKLIKLINSSPEDIIRELSKIGFSEVNGTEIRPSDKIKALELIGKQKGMFQESAMNVGAFQININLGDTEPTSVNAESSETNE